MEIFGDYHYGHYSDAFKIVLAFYILFGSFVLSVLFTQKNRFKRHDKGLLLSFLFFLILFIGLRKYDIGTDTSNYLNFYFIPVTTQVSSYFQIFARLKSDLLFELLMSFSYWHRNYSIFLLSVSIIMNVSLYIFVRRFTNFGNKGSSLLLFLTLASSFSFLSIETNILRNGLSLCFVLLGLNALLEHEKRKKIIIYFIIAYFFHRTAIIPVVLFAVISYFDRVEIKYYLAFYGLAILASLAGFGFHAIPFLSQLGGEDFARLSYVGDTTYRIGFRYDFVLYNTFFLVLFFKFTNWNSTDTYLIKYYILASTVFFFNFYIPFSDRFGVYSWIIIPLLLFNTVNEAFPKKKIFVSKIVLIGFYVINHIILF